MPLELSIPSSFNDGLYQGGSFNECLAPKDTPPLTGDIIGNTIESIAVNRLVALGKTKGLSIFRGMTIFCRIEHGRRYRESLVGLPCLGTQRLHGLHRGARRNHRLHALSDVTQSCEPRVNADYDVGMASPSLVKSVVQVI
jgi:hypothetical protein